MGVESRKVAGSMRSLRFVVLLGIVVLGCSSACNDDAPPGPSDPPDASVPVTCTGAGVELCGGACVNTSSDPKHCGACGRACTTGEVCEGSVCSPKCLIGGVLYAAGTPNPANACEACVPATSTAQWTARASVPLLVGGQDLAAQGWTAASQAPNTLTYGADYVRLATSTNSGGRTSGALLISLANALDGTKPFKIHVTMQVESVDRHNALDSGAAILGSFTPPFGNATDRSQMIYLDSAAIGWADDTQSAAFAVTDGAYHVYELAVDAAKVATVSIDGVAKLTRNNFTTNGTLALGDQTNDPSVDGAVRIQSVERLCP